MDEEQIYKLIRSSEVAIKENLLLADELKSIKENIEEFLDNNLKQGSLIHLRYRKLKRQIRNRGLWKSEEGYPIGGPDWIRPWIEIFEQYLGEKKIKRRFENEGFWVQSNIQGNEEHIFIGKKDGSSDKVHLIIGETGEIRIDVKDQKPHDVLRKVETILTTKSGEKIRSTHAMLEFDDEIKK